MLPAEPQVVLSSISQSEMKQRLKELEQMKKGKLDSRSRQMLDDLWQEASEIAEMNDRCATMSLTEALDDDCDHFYKKTLPEFEDKFFLVTGEIRLNSWELRSGVEAKAQMIQSCYDAFPLYNTNPTMLFVPDGKFSPEPLLEGNVEVMYDMELYTSDSRQNAVRKQLKEWFYSCEKYILRTGSSEFAPMFLQLLETDRLEANSMHLQKESDRSFSVITTKGFRAEYSLNGKVIMTHEIKPNTRIAQVYSNGNVNMSRLDATASRGRMELSERDMRRGLVGHIEWLEVTRYTKATTVAPEYTSTKSYSTSDYVKPNDASDDGMHLGFQFRTGLGLGMSGAVNDELKRKYPDVWPGDKDREDIADSSLIHGYWPWLLMMRIYGGSFAFGVGGGAAFVWASVSEAEGYTNLQAGDNLYLRTYIDPVAQAEIGFRKKISVDQKNEDYNLEFGLRETILFDNEWTTMLTGVYFKFFDVFDFEIGWHYGMNFSNSAFAAFSISLPPHTN